MTTPSKRVTNVQVPGAPAPVANINASASGTGTDSSVTTATSALPPPNQAPPSLKLDVDQATMAKVRDREMDWEEERTRIREEERAILRDELGAQMQAATSAASMVIGYKQSAPRSKSDYRNMRAADIDPTTLIAPVRTLDGWLCPPAPEAKK